MHLKNELQGSAFSIILMTFDLESSHSMSIGRFMFSIHISYLPARLKRKSIPLFSGRDFRCMRPSIFFVGESATMSSKIFPLHLAFLVLNFVVRKSSFVNNGSLYNCLALFLQKLLQIESASGSLSSCAAAFPAYKNLRTYHSPGSCAYLPIYIYYPCFYLF